jgi:sugar phosphate isomerase/epimerase
MKTSLNGAGLGAGTLGLAGFVDLAARQGFDGVDFGLGGAQKLADERGGAGAVRALFDEKNVAPATFGLEIEWRRDEATFNDGLTAFKEKLPLARAIGADRCVTWMPPSVNDEPAAWEAQTVRRFRLVARVLADHGVRFGLEWVGPKHLRAGDGAMGRNVWIHTLDGTLALVREIGEPNVGLLVDCYHCYTTGIGEAELAKLSDDQIVHVHVNDAKRGVPVDAVKDGDRVLPGDGAIDLAGFLNGLRAAGYRGYIAPEVLAPQPLAADPETAAANVRASLRNIGL